ncbi:hypothetical protein F2Q69_00022235 [Brassica cretica]|uniref:Aspartic peptidase DDI1-type domain-containing protein n=1 Tax=Brassica cretica TaxID=69181 RepID=A0A8S9QEN4_BRACR|nr:hypothetical protein F2Q69_00022235 [Brassica cretica]
MFFRETRETEEDIRRMFCEAREKMRMGITLNKKSDHAQFAIPCTVKGIEFPHALCDTGASVSILPRAFLSTVGAVCNLQTNQLFLTLIDPNAHYNPIPVKKPQMTSRRINDPGIIAACHCGAEYATENSASIEITLQHRSTVPIRYRPTPRRKNRSTAVHMIGRTTTIIPPWQHTPRIQRSMMKIMRKNELYSKERLLTRKIDFSIIPLGKESHHRSITMIQHRSTLNLTNQTTFEHRPITPTSHRSTLTSVLPETEITQLAVGQMIAITRAMQ